MLAALGVASSLLKLRIGVAIAASAVAGVAATPGAALPAWKVVALAVAVLGASGAAGAFNHYHERELDRRMARTRSRPFASGLLAPGLAWPLSFALLLALSLSLSYAAAGVVSTIFVFLGAFTYGVVYTVWLKRRTAWNIVVGGLAGSFAVLAGAAAVDPSPRAVPVILALVMFLWTPPHFWSLAAVKRDDYASAGVPMLPVTASERFWTTAVLAHTAALSALSIAPLWFGLGPVYGVFAASGGAYFLHRSWRLYRAPSKAAAGANFGASLVQLTLLTAGVILDRQVAGSAWLPWA